MLLFFVLGALELEAHGKPALGCLSKNSKAQRPASRMAIKGGGWAQTASGTRCRVWEYQIPENPQIPRRRPPGCVPRRLCRPAGAG